MECYTELDLESFLQNKMKLSDVARCQEHLQVCSTCQGKLHEVRRDEELLQALRDSQKLFQRYSN